MYTDIVLLHSFSGVDCDSILGRVSRFDSKIVIFDIKIQVRMNELFKLNFLFRREKGRDLVFDPRPTAMRRILIRLKGAARKDLT